MAILKIPKKSRDEKLYKLSAEERRQLDEIELDTIARFQGQFDELESAIGMLRLGHHVGWKVLYTIHSKATIRKYEDILQIKIRELFRETGPSSYRSAGFHIVQKLTNFWKSIGGDEKIPERRRLLS